MTTNRLTVATCQMPVLADCRENGRVMRTFIAAAAGLGADVAHFGEAALSGYGGVSFSSWEGYDWEALRQETEAVMVCCREFRIAAVFGSSHPLSSGHLPHNCVYVVGDDGSLLDRYDKRICSVRDCRNYMPGDHLVAFPLKGVQCGVLICMESRFPELWLGYNRLDVDLVFHSTSSSLKLTADTLFSDIAIPMMQAHAHQHECFISMAGWCPAYQEFPSAWLRRSGRVGCLSPRHEAGIIINCIADEPEKDAFYAMVRQSRRQARDGDRYRDLIRPDPRSLQRQAL